MDVGNTVQLVDVPKNLVGKSATVVSTDPLKVRVGMGWYQLELTVREDQVSK